MTEVEKLKAQVKRLRRERDDWRDAAQVNLETITNRQREVERLRAVLSRISRQGPNHGVDGQPWEHWATIARNALVSPPSSTGGESER